MKLRIAIWAGADALVVFLWTLYISVTHYSALGIVRTQHLFCPLRECRNIFVGRCSWKQRGASPDNPSNPKLILNNDVAS